MADHIKYSYFRAHCYLCCSNPSSSHGQGLYSRPLQVPLLMIRLRRCPKSKFFLASIGNSKLIDRKLWVIFILSKQQFHLFLIDTLELDVDEFLFVSSLSIDHTPVYIHEEEAAIIVKLSGIGEGRLWVASNHLVSLRFFILTILNFLLFLLLLWLLLFTLLLCYWFFDIKLNFVIGAVRFDIHRLLFLYFPSVFINLAVIVRAIEFSSNRYDPSEVKLLYFEQLLFLLDAPYAKFFQSASDQGVGLHYFHHYDVWCVHYWPWCTVFPAILDAL